VEYVAGYIVCPSVREREQRGHRDRCHSNFFHPFLRSATIAARTTSTGDLITTLSIMRQNVQGLYRKSGLLEHRSVDGEIVWLEIKAVPVA
jgi:hypothetical protein